jgi:ATP-binding cassette subfamily F protein 3
MERLESPQEEKKISFQFNEPVRSGKVVLELKGVAKAFGGNVLYQDIDLTLTRGDCLAFLGPNGAGKSTLIKIMAGLIQPDRGERLLGHNVTLAYFAQNQLEQLTGERTVWQEASGVAGDRTYGNLRNLLAAFLFRSDEEIQKKVSVLSGGEKSRLVILKMLLGGANFLLFDEPTNHLDIPSRDILEEALKSFNGTLCLITHDRHLIDALAGRVAYLKDGRLEIFPGNYQDFEQVWKGKIEAGPETDLNPARGLQSKAISGGKKDRREKREEADRRNALFRMKAPLQKEIAALEQEISRLEAEKETVEKTLADPDFYRAGSGIQGAHQRYGQIQKEIEELTARWGEALARLEALEKTEV